MDDYEKFIANLQRELNLDLSGYKRPQMERRINTLMRTLGVPDYNAFVSLLSRDRQIFERFLDHLTINVSEFFRNLNQWQVLETKIIPQLVAENRNLNIWSAGCSTGEEPYSLAMLLSERFPGKHHILATDFDDRVLKKAQLGYYLNKGLVGVPEEYLRKYFIQEREGYRIKEELKNNITFRHHNLLKDKFPEQMDLIICRNVVIYFTEVTKNVLYRQFYHALRPKGVLFTGSTEQIITAREIGYESAAVFFYLKPR